MDAQALLAHIEQQYPIELGSIPVCGIELEFYVEGEHPDWFISNLKAYCDAHQDILPVEAIKAEVGLHQYEAEFGPTLEVRELAQVVERFREHAARYAEQHGYRFICETKPYPDRPSCGMHVHISLVDEAHRNLFARNAGRENELLYYAVGGLLETLPAAMRYLAPKEICYSRYQQAEGTKYIDTPTTISWGGNNRTVAIRLPESTLQEHTRRIEHRVPSVEASVSMVIFVLLCGIKYGITGKVLPDSPKIYGYAFEPQHGLRKLPQSLEEALGYDHQALALMHI